MWNTDYLTPPTENDDFDLFPPLAKRSKEVNRFSEGNDPYVQPQHAFQRTEVLNEESFRIQPVLPPELYSAAAAGLWSKPNGMTLGLTHEKLPHPSKLMGKKRKVRSGQTHTARVLKHIEELRIQQRHINELKGDKWWGATSMPGPEDIRGPQESIEKEKEQLCGLPSEVSFREMLVESSDVTMTQPYRPMQYLPTHQLSFTGYEHFLDLAPRGSPSMALLAGTAHRSVFMAESVARNSADGMMRSHEEEMTLLQNIEFF